MSRRPSRLASGLLVPLLLVLAGCGSEPEPLEALPPLAPEDLCALLPEAATQGFTGTSSSSPDGNPTAACSLRRTNGDNVLVTWLQMGDTSEGTRAYESQCNAIDRAALPEEQATVEGADETCAGASGDQAPQRSSLVALSGRAVVTVRVSTTDADQAPLARAVALTEDLLEELPNPQ